MSAVVEHRAGSVQRVVRLAPLLLRGQPRQRSAWLLPIAAFGVTTAMALLVLGGARMFLATPTTGAGAFYPILGGLALGLLAIPLATLGAAAARLTARLRNDRLATLRLLGATTAEVSALTVLEPTLLAGAGAAVGAVLYLALLPAAGRLPFFGAPVGVDALWIGPELCLVTVLAVVVTGVLSAVAGLRRVVISPLGVRRRTDPPRARVKTLIVGVIGFGVVLGVVSQVGSLASSVAPLLLVTALIALFAGALALVGVIGTPVIALRGRVMAARATSPARLIAGKELAAHPGVAWRRVSGIATISFIAVISGAGAAIASLPGASVETTLFADIRTGVLLTLGIGFLLLACSVGVTQAASVLEDRALIVGLDRIGMPLREIERARRIATMTPLRWASIGGALAAVVLSLPIVGISVIVAPESLLMVAATFVSGIGLVWLALLASRPLTRGMIRPAG